MIFDKITYTAPLSSINLVLCLAMKEMRNWIYELMRDWFYSFQFSGIKRDE